MSDKNHFHKTLGNRLKTIRKEKGLTQLDAANLMLMDFQAISRYERGQQAPSFYWIVEYCTNLRVSPVKFMEDFYKDLNKN